MRVFPSCSSLSVIVPLLIHLREGPTVPPLHCLCADAVRISIHSATLPKNLIPPAKLNIPANTRIEVTGCDERRGPILPPDSEKFDAYFESSICVNAVIESDQQNVHAVFQLGWRATQA